MTRRVASLMNGAIKLIIFMYQMAYGRQFEGKFYKAKPKRKSRAFGFWFAITRPNRVF